MRTILFSLLLASGLASAEEFVCSYPGYETGEPIMMKIKVNDSVAKIEISPFLPVTYNVLENNRSVLILARPHGDKDSYLENDFGLVGVIIDRKKMKMVRGSIFYGGKTNKLKYGSCVK